MGTAGDLACRDLVELVTEFLEDALAPVERARFEAHLRGCPGCSAHVGQMRITVRLVRASGELARHVIDITLGIFDSSRTERHVALTTRAERPAPLPIGLPANQLDA